MFLKSVLSSHSDNTGLLDLSLEICLVLPNEEQNNFTTLHVGTDIIHNGWRLVSPDIRCLGGYLLGSLFVRIDVSSR